MTSRTVVTAAIFISLLAGCASEDEPASPTTTPDPTVVASPGPTEIPTSPASATPTPTPTPSPEPSAGPLTIAGEYTFGHNHFGNVLLYQNVDGYYITLGNDVHSSACGDAATAPTLYPTTVTPATWELFLVTNWDDPAVVNPTVQSFLLVVPSDVLPTTQVGPVGPRGLRLGTAESVIETMFPAEAAASTQRSTPILDFATDSEITIVERVFTIADVEGSPMVITTVDGYVATIMWGDPAYVSAQQGRLRCTT